MTLLQLAGMVMQLAVNIIVTLRGSKPVENAKSLESSKDPCCGLHCTMAQQVVKCSQDPQVIGKISNFCSGF